MDYYKILGLDASSASRDDIANAFRQLSVKNHPMKNMDTLAISQAEFNKICEAYEVLSDPKLRAEYDQHGEVGLKNGTTRKKTGKVVGSYCFRGNSIEIFQAFFGNANPFTDNVKEEDVVLPKEQEEEDPEAPKDIEVVLGCTIFEFYNGSIKNLEFTRQVLEPDGRTLRNQDE